MKSKIGGTWLALVQAAVLGATSLAHASQPLSAVQIESVASAQGRKAPGVTIAGLDADIVQVEVGAQVTRAGGTAVIGTERTASLSLADTRTGCRRGGSGPAKRDNRPS